MNIRSLQMLVRPMGATLKLAGPIIMARAGWMVMSLVDIIMVGRYSTDELAYLSLANSLISVAYVTMMGMMLGTLVVSSNLYGEQRFDEIGAVWRRSLPYALFLGFVVLALASVAEPFMLWTGQDPIVARETAAVMLVYGYGMPLGSLLYVTSQYFLEAIKDPVPAMLLMLVANIINVPLNWAMIYGHVGFEPMGAAGSAWATTIIRIALALAIITYIRRMPGARRFGIHKPLAGGWRAWSEQRRLGYAAGLSFGIEHVSFVALFVFAGLLGTLDLAAVTIVFNTFGFFFMIASGIANATAVHVGVAWGSQDHAGVRIAGWAGWFLQLAILSLPALLMVLQPALFARIYTEDPGVIALALPLYVLAGYALLLDTSQTLWSNALRARHDKWFATVSHFLSYGLVMVPCGWYLAFPAGYRSLGLFMALVIASIASVTALTARFVWLSRRDRLPAAAEQH